MCVCALLLAAAVGCGDPAADDLRTNYTMTYAAIPGFIRVRPTAGDKRIPESLWVGKDEAEAIMARRRTEAEALGYRERSFSLDHAFRRWVRRFWDTHREYFGLLPNGRRGVEVEGLPDWIKDGSKICVSNEDVVRRVIVDWVNGGKQEILNCCEMDCLFGYCRCEKCRALDADRPGERFLATKTDRYVNFWNRIADGARKLRPDVQIAVHLYGRYYDPPRRERILHPDNMIFSFVAKYQDPDPIATLEGWKKAGLRHFYYRPNYLCNLSVFPIGREKFIWRMHRRMLAAGSLGDVYDVAGGVPATDFDLYTALRLCCDPNLTFREIEGEWCARFGAAAETVKAYQTRLRERCDRAFEKLLAELKATDTEFLDDSHFSCHYHRFHSVRDLEGDLAFLERFDASGLDGEAKRRFDDLKVNARHYILTKRACETESEEDKRTLLDYRIAHKSSLGTQWRGCWNRGEYWLWDRSPERRRYVETGIVRVVEAIEESLPR